MLSRDKIWGQAAEEFDPSLTRWIGPLLYYFARLIKAKVTLEIGVGRGFTSFALGLYANDFRARHYAVDKNPNTVRVINRVNSQFGLSVNFLRRDIVQGLKWEGNDKIDLLFLDILAEEDDFQIIFEDLHYNHYLRSDGFIIIHDYFCYRNIRKSVDRFFREQWRYENILAIPHDGEPRSSEAKSDGPCGLVIIRN